MAVGLSASATAQPFTLEETFDTELTSPTKAVFVDLDGMGDGIMVANDLVINNEGNVFSATDNGNLQFYLYQAGTTGTGTYSDPLTALPTEFTALAGFDIADFVPDAIGFVDGVIAGSRSGQPGPFPLGSLTTFENQGFPFVPLTLRQTLVSGLRDVRIARLADLTGDGLLDVVSFYLDGSNVGRGVYFAGTGSGNFSTTPTAISAPSTSGGISNVRGVDFADLDDDGDLDVLAAGGGLVAAYLNNGSGGFTTVLNSTALGGPQDVQAGDVNGDGTLDAVAAGQGADAIGYFPGDGAGGFGTLVTITSSETGVNNLAVGDVDGDGDDDIVTAAAFGGDRFAYYESFGGGQFAGPVVIEAAANLVPRDIVIEDLEDDGDLDVITVSRSSEANIYRNGLTPATASVPASAFFGADGEEETGAGWRLLAPPVGDLSVGSLAGINLVQGVAGQYPDAPGANLLYDFTSGGYETAASADQPLRIGRGFFWYWYDRDIVPNEADYGDGAGVSAENASIALSATGPERVTDQTIAFGERTSESGPAVYLLGNPFVQDLTAEAGATITLASGGGTLATTFQTWDPGLNEGAGGFIAIDATDGDPSNDIASVWQGFFAEVTGGTAAPAFTFAASGRTTGGTLAARTEPDAGHLRIALTGTTASGTVVGDALANLRVREDAEIGDDRYDASELAPFSAVSAGLAVSGERRHAVRSLPTDLPIPFRTTLAFRTDEAGTFEIAFDAALPEGWRVQIADTETGAEFDPTVTPTYAFAANAGDWTDRFKLTIEAFSVAGGTEPNVVLGLSAVAPNPARGSLAATLTLATPERVTVRVLDALGREVARLADGAVLSGVHTLTLDASSLAPGAYLLRAEGDSFAHIRPFTVVR